MPKKLSRYLLFLILSFTLLTTQGCFALFVGAAGSAGGYAFYKGKLAQNVDYSVKKVHTACVAALRDLGMFVKDDDLNQDSADFKAEFDDGKDVIIRINKLTEKASQIVIRIGLFGDEARSRLILDAILKELK